MISSDTYVPNSHDDRPSKGFVAGCSDGGLRLYVMDHAENPSPTKMFECKQSWRVDTTADMVSSKYSRYSGEALDTWYIFR